MILRISIVLATWLVTIGVLAQEAPETALKFPAGLRAGQEFSVPTQGMGKAVLYVVGPGAALRRDVQLGEPVAFHSDDLRKAGHYTAFLVGTASAQSTDFDIAPDQAPATLSFLAKPSRLPVDLKDRVSGVVYVFDAFDNLILEPKKISFSLSEGTGTGHSQTVETRNGVAWIKLDSAPKAGAAQFVAQAGTITETRIVQQVPGDPCTLRMTAHKSGERIEVETDPLRDCRGNPVPDGTIVTFKEAYDGKIATVDAPLKRGVARTTLPASNGAVISVATGVVLGNEIHWQEGR